MSNFRRKTFIRIFIPIILLLGTFLLSLNSGHAAIRKEFNYQGKLTDASGLAVADGAYDVTFKIYTQAGGGTAVWTEDWNVANLFTDSGTTIENDGCASGVDKISYTSDTNESSLAAGQTIWNVNKKQSTVIESVNTASNYICAYDPASIWASGDQVTNRIYVKNGLFSVMVGSVTPQTMIFTGSNYYLGVTVGSDAEMVPRKKIGSVPQAWNANSLSGSGLIDIDNASVLQDAANINYNPVSGNYNAFSLIYGSAGGTGTALSVLQQGTGNIVDINNGSGSVFEILNNGNVGIGTNSPSSKLDIAAGNLDLDNTTNANQYGVITKNGTRFIHDFNYGSNGTVTTDGGNIFVGLNSGNLTMGSGATQTYEASYNAGVGYFSLFSNTAGYSNSGLGSYALSSNTTGYRNSALGFDSGRYIADGSTANQTSNTSLYLGADTKALADGDVNEIVIGYNAIGLGSDTAVLGNSLTTTTALRGNVGIGTTSPSAKLSILGGEGTYAAPNFGSSNLGSINILSTTSDRRNGITFSSAGSSNAQAGIYVHQDASAGTRMYLATTNSYAIGPQARITILNNGDVGIGTTSPGVKLDISGGSIRTTGQFISTAASGTAPLSVISNTLVSNLNADLLDGTSLENIVSKSPDLSLNQYNQYYYMQFGTITIPSGQSSFANAWIILMQGYEVSPDYQKMGIIKLILRRDTLDNAIYSLSVSSLGTRKIDPIYCTSDDGVTYKLYYKVEAKTNYSGFYKFKVLQGSNILAAGTHIDTDTAPTGTKYTWTATESGTIGTSNYIPKFNSSGGLSDSLIYNTGTGVGIGTTAPGTVLPNNFVNDGNQRVLEIKSNTAVAGDSGLFIRRGEPSYDIGLDLWTDVSNGFSFIDNRYDNTNYGIKFRTRTAGTPVEVMYLGGTGNVGIGTTSPAAVLHLKAGTATANTAPLKLTSGTNLASPEAGAVEYDGTSLYFTPSTIRKTIAFTDSNITGTASNVTGVVAAANGGTGQDFSAWSGIPHVVSGTWSAMNGTANYTTRWTDANTLGTGALYDNGTSVGVGTASPLANLHVVGNSIVTGVANFSGSVAIDTNPDNNSSGFEYGNGYDPLLSNFYNERFRVNSFLETPHLSLGVASNYLLRSEEFDISSWVKTGIGTVTANSARCPTGTTSAENIPAGSDAAANVAQTVTNSTTGYWSAGIWARAQSGTATISLEIDSSAETGTPKEVTLDTTWRFFGVKQNFTAAHTTKTFKIISGTNAVSLWGARLNPGEAVNAYYVTSSSNLTSQTVGAFFNGTPIYGNLSGNATSSTYSTRGMYGGLSLSDAADKTGKWELIGSATLTFNSTYSYGQSFNYEINLKEHSDNSTELPQENYEDITLKLRGALDSVAGNSTTFNTTVPNFSVEIAGDTELTSSDVAALVYSTSISSKIIRVYVKLPHPNVAYEINPINYAAFSYNSAAVASVSTTYLSFTPFNSAAILTALPTPVQGSVVYGAIKDSIFRANVGIGTNSPSSKLDIAAGNLDLDNTTNANQYGVITKNGTRFIHDFNYGSNGTVTTDGGNIFVGLNSGNLTMGSGATQTYEASYNTAVGSSTLTSNTTGYSNSAFGRAALYSNTTGYYNSSLGIDAGRYIADGSTANQTSNTSLYLGAETKALADGDANEIVIGYNAVGLGSNTVVLGNSSITTTVLRGNVGIGTTNPGAKLNVVGGTDESWVLKTEYPTTLTNGVASSFYLKTKSTGDMVDGFGGGIVFALEDNAGVENIAGTIYGLRNGADNNGALTLNTYNAGTRYERVRIDSSGNVGIGTTTPAEKLQVAGNIDMTGNNRKIYMGGTGSTTFGLVFNQSYPNHGLFYYREGSPDYVTISPNGGGITNPVAFFSGNGNVGIGTISPSAKLDISVGNLNLDNTTNTNQYGVITKNGTRFIHDFNYGSIGAITTAGENTFVGLNAGNLTMGNTAIQAFHASYNSALGYTALYSNTTGYSNSALGNAALYSNTTGYENSALGRLALYSNTTGYYNSALGAFALSSNTTGYSNSALGANAGRYIADGSTANQVSNSCLYLGAYTKALADGDTNEVVIGYNAVGLGSNTVVLGNSNIATTILRGTVGIGTESPNSLYGLDVSGSIHGTDYYSSDGSAGISTTINVRKADDSGTCTITVKNGLITATDCP